MNSKIADTIKQDLITQLQSSSDLPFNLTLAAIAEHYSVSLTPVREVIGNLIEQNIILRKPNGRLEVIKGASLNKKVKPSSQSSDNSLDFNSKLDEQVTNYVLELSLKKYDGYLREEATAKKYDTGRTIMRQVFSRLAGAGFLQHVPRCGWKVRSIREKDMSDYLEIREILEIKALTLARPYFRKQELQTLLDANIVSDNPQLTSIDNDLHNYWIKLCDNHYIQDFFDRHGSFYTAVFEFASLGEHIESDMSQEHRNILENLIAENWKQAERALIKHIRDQKKNLLDQVRL